MVTYIQRGGIFIITLFLLSGCATTPTKHTELEMQKLRAQLHAKEQELKQSEKEIEDMEWQLEKERQMRRGREKQLAATKTESGKKSVEVSTKNIQKALRQAGFYNGAIDGELGPRTKEAIKRFQKANGLKADGIVGKKTWQKLSQHL